MRSTMRTMVLASALLAAACGTRGALPQPATASAPAPAPARAAASTYDSYGHRLVTVAPGVQVIANYDQPVFYAERFYWRAENGTWYRSPIPTAGWVRAPAPRALLRIKHPQAYVHYHSPAHTHYGRARSARRPDPPRSMYQSPPRRLDPARQMDTRPNGGLAR